MTVVVPVKAAMEKVDLIFVKHTAGFLHFAIVVVSTHESQTSCYYYEENFQSISKHDW